MRLGRSGWFPLLCLLACAPLGAAPKEVPAVSTKLECSLSVPPRARVGEPLMLRFRLTNRSAQPVYVLNWLTPLEGLLGDILKVTRGETAIAYQGPKVKRGDPEADEYVTLAPGDSAEAEIDVTLAYELTQPGRHRIAFSREGLMDVTTSRAEVPRPLAKHRAFPLQCAAVETELAAP
jgi:uncharacterized protein (DUF58 family)